MKTTDRISFRRFVPCLASLAGALFAFAPVSARADLAANKTLVQAFYDLAFNQHRAKEAALKYLSSDYVQHNPHVATGRQAFIDAFAGETDDQSRAEFK